MFGELGSPVDVIEEVQLETEFDALCERLGFAPAGGGSITLASNESPVATGPAATGANVDADERIGRYIVIGRLGAGAMGVVYAAYDPKLDRKVALKLLGKPDGDGVESARKRLEREAQALAKLADPHVVAVYDVDVHAGQLFVAMELVDGETLAAWLRRPRPWPEVLDKFMAAGRGLAAAHAAGLVHRDFKPDNVMLGNDGRVRVMDFGLARAQIQPGLEAARASVDPRGLPAVLTQTGAVMGTPAYMAPEQFDGRADARSDQFGFCVALYEGLYGQRPFASDSLARLLGAIMSGTLAPTPKGATVPTWLRDVVVRGLAVDPSLRWPSMAALLDALAADPRRRRRRLGAWALAVATLAGATAAVAIAARGQDRTCEGFERELVGVWDAEHKQRVRAAIEGTGQSYATASWRGVEQRLDDYAQRWLAARRDACEATQRGAQSGELLDLRMRCLDDRFEHFTATIEVLRNADADVVRNAIEAVAGLPGLQRCADIEALTAELPAPEDAALAERVAAIDDRLIEAKTLERAGKYERGLELATSLATEAEQLGYEPVQVRAWLTRATLAERVGDYADAERDLERAYASALGLKMLAEAAEASQRLVELVGDALARPEQGRAWARDAGPLARAVGSDDALAGYHRRLANLAVREGEFDDAVAHLQQALTIEQATLAADHPELAETLIDLGTVAYQAGDYEEARAHYERALGIRERALGSDHPLVGTTLTNLAKLAEVQAHYDEARDHSERALAILTRALGPEHREIGITLHSLGRLATAEGRYDDARGHLERALAILARSLGPNHPDLGTTLDSLGILADIAGDYAQARAYYERALAIHERALGLDHPKLASSLNNLGLVVQAEGDLALARAYFERALAVRERAFGPEHPALAISLCNLGSVALLERDYAAALDYYERALTIDQRSLGSEHADLGYSLHGVGEALLGLARPGDAIVPLERALALRSAQPGNPFDLAQVQDALALALWDASLDSGRDRIRARELAELAASGYMTAGAHADVEAVRAWLAAHAR